MRGKRVLSTQEGIRGLGEFLNQSNITLSEDNPESYSNHLQKIILNMNGFDINRNTALQLIKAKYNWQHSSEMVFSIFEDLLTR